MTKQLRISSAILLFAASLPLGATQGANEQLKVTLNAASFDAKGQMVVKLAWTIDEGWVPDSGFRLVRQVQAVSTPLNAQPLKPSTKLATTEAWTMAKRALTKPVAAEPVRVKESSMAVFEAAAVSAKSATTAKRGTNAAAVSKAIAADPAVKSYFGRLKQTATKQPPKALAKVATQLDSNEETAMMREKLMLSASVDETLGADLGLRFTDTQVTKGQVCQYQLRATINGVDTLLASTSVTVGSDTNTAKPVVATPLQVGQKHVQLHIELPPSVSDSLGTITFDVFRGQPTALTQLNKDPIMPTYVETSDGKLTPTLVGFEDKQAPLGKVIYTVISTDMFGRKSQPTVVAGEVLDLAGPAASSPVAVIRQNQVIQPGAGEKVNVTKKSAIPGPSSVRVIWSPVQQISDDTPYTPGAIAYRVDRVDLDVNPNQVSAIATPIAGLPANLSTIDVRTLCKLRPDIQVWVTKAISASAATSGRGDGTSKGITEKIYDMKAATFLQTYQEALPAASRTVNLVEFLDNAPPTDKMLAYQVTPILMRNQREANPGISGSVGIPATTMPGTPVITKLQDDPAPQTAIGLKALAAGSIANAALVQLTPGVKGATGVIKENAAIGAKQLGAEALKSSVTAGVGKGTAVPVNGTQKAGTAPKVVVKGGLANSYGRMVTLTWTQPAYPSPVQYRVFRANGTGFQPLSGSTGAGKPPSDALNASAEQVNQAKPANGQVKQAQGVVPKITRSKPALVPTAVKVGNSLQAFSLDSSPPADQYLELGLTKPGATQFVDLLPVSQSNTFYYYVLPVNRWGTTGTPTAPSKVKVKPSLTPSTPALQGAFAQPDGSIQLRVVPNIQTEDVITYKVLRLEIPVPPTPPAQPASGPAKPVYATGPTKVAAQAYAKTVDGQTLTAVNGGAGATKFGVESHSSPLSALGSLQASVSGAQLQISAALNKVFDLTAYSVVQVTALPLDANGLLNLKDTTVVVGKYYAYRVVAVNSANLSSEASQFLDAGALKVKADPPTVTGAFDAANQRVVLTITPPTTGANAYVVERQSAAPGAQWTKLGVIPIAAQFQDTMALSGRTYKYRVSVIDAAGNLSVPSAEVTVVVP